MRRFHKIPLTAAGLVNALIAGTRRLYVQNPGGFNRCERWRGFEIDERGAERRRVAGRTITLLSSEGYISRKQAGVMWTPHGLEYKGRQRPIQVDEWEVTAKGRQAAAKPYEEVQ